MMTGNVRSLPRPQPAANLEARDAGQHPVENDEIGRVLGEPQFGFVAAPDTLDDIALRFEIVAEQQREIGFVLDDEDARRRHPVCADALPARFLIHTSPPAASMSMSVSCRPCGRSDGIASPVTR